MTTPDHRPYLLPTDLRTAEDVAEWLREQIYEWDADCDTANPRQVVTCVAIALERRLDRERRQACRRGALACWRKVCEDLDYSGLPRMVWDGADTFAEAEHVRRLLRHLTRALAFRAAARAW